MAASYDGIRNFGICKNRDVGKLWIEKYASLVLLHFFPRI